MNIGVVSFQNKDVTKAINELADRYKTESPRVLIPVTTEDQEFIQSVLRACIENKIPVVCFISHAAGLDHLLKQADDIVVSDNPVKEVMHQLTIGDSFCIAWDDSIPAHHLLHAVEDLALDVWDITDGLDPIEIDDEREYESDDLYDLMHESLGTFIDALAAFVGSVVMESLTQAVAERLRETDEGNRDISPFDDLD